MDFDSYEINCDTLVVGYIDENNSLVYEGTSHFIVHKSCLDIIQDSCLFFGSSLNGRLEASREFLNSNLKVPIIIEESREIIFFPTGGLKSVGCIWISYSNLVKYNVDSYRVTNLVFKNNINILVNVSCSVIDNQVIRCIKFELFWRRRKELACKF